MTITRNFNLHLNAGASTPLLINANQYDSGEEWVFTLYSDRGVKYTPASGAIIGLKSDGHAIANNATVNGSGQIVVTETEQMTASVGKNVYELSIDSGTHGTANFIVLVEPQPYDESKASDSDISLMQEAINAASHIQPYGTPLVANTASAMTDHDKVYVYTGSEQGYTSGHWYYWNGSAWSDGGTYNSQGIGAGTVNGQKLSMDLKEAFLAMFQHVVWKDKDSEDYYNDLVDAFNAGAVLLSIEATFTQGTTVIYDKPTTFDDLKQYLVVTALYDDDTEVEISSYTLSGTLTVGTSTITVSYGGKTTTFTVNVTSYKTVMHYALADGDLTKIAYSVNYNDTLGLRIAESASRRCMVLMYGDHVLKETDATTQEIVDSIYYPIPVPPTATKFTCTVTPNTSYMGVMQWIWDTDHYSRVESSGWQQGSYTKTFTAGTIEYLTVNLKYDSAGTSYPSEPTNYVIQFE